MSREEYQFIEESVLEMDKETIWKELLHKLEAEVPNGRIASTFSRAIPLGVTDNGEFIIGVHNKFNQDVINKFHVDAMSRILKEIVGIEMRCITIFDENLKPEYQPEDTPVSQKQDISPLLTSIPQNDTTSTVDQPPYNPKYTFDSFIVGDTNNFAYSAALAVAEQPGLKYNPLFIWGGPGLGKTHLLQAIGNYIKVTYPHKKVTYVTTEELVTQFINAVTTKSVDIDYLRNTYRSTDVLVVDDIQFMEGKSSTIDFFFHTFNHLQSLHKQIVIAADRSPNDLKMDERLTSRFSQGLLVDIQPPTYEVRLAILKQYTKSLDVLFSEESLSYIAEKSSGSIREMEGAGTRVVAFAGLRNRVSVDLEFVKAATIGSFNEQHLRPLSISTIQSEVCKYYSIQKPDLIGSKRKQDLVYPRHIAMYLCSELTDSSYTKIGQAFGKRDHATVIHAVAKIKKMMSKEKSVFSQIQELSDTIKRKNV